MASKSHPTPERIMSLLSEIT